MIKKFTFLVLGLMLGVGFATAQVVINETNFPDSVFRSYVKTTFDTDANDTLSVGEISNAKIVEVSSKSISSLKGIEYFTNVESLTCFSNNIDTLNLSANTKLHSLDCSSNPIKSLDVSKCSALQDITFSPCDVDSIDLANKPNLGYIYADDNNLTKLDLTNDPAVYYISITGNPIDSIDLTQLSKLTTLYADGTNIKHLDVTKNPELDLINATNDSIGSIDLSKNTKLTQVNLDNCSLTSLDLSADTLLTDVSIGSNPIGSIDVSNLKKMVSLSCNACELTSLDVSAAGDALEVFECANNHLTKLDVSKNTKLTRLICFNNNLVAVDISACTDTINNDNFDAGTNKKEVKVDGEGNMDLTALAPFGFNVDKASNWVDGTVTGTQLKFDDINTNATYKYDCGQGKFAIFTLIPVVSTGVNTVAGADVKAFATGNVINITGTDAQARVWDVAGRAVYSGANRQISVASAGVYVVKVAGKTFKVIIK
jgi:hypothetical protein